MLDPSEDAIGRGCDPIGEHRLLEQADRKQAQSDCQVLAVQPRRQALELRHHLAEVHDRAGDELRKEEDEYQKVEGAEISDGA